MYTRLESEGATATSILPIGEWGRAGSVIFFQVAPASCDTYKALEGPPLNMAHVCISTCHMPAKIVLGCITSSDRPEQPVLGSTKSERVHVWPPSPVLYTPRSCCG